MGPIGGLTRTQLRARWRSWLALALLIGAFAGIVLGVAMGARRTATAFPRLVESSQATQALVSAFGTGLDGFYDELGEDDQVEEIGLIAGMPVVPLNAEGKPDESAGNVIAPIDGRHAYALDRPQVLEGRLPDPDHPREVFVNELSARAQGLRVGSRVPLVAIKSDPDDFEGEPLGLTPFTGIVVGIGRFIEEVVPTAKFDISERMLISPAAYPEYGTGNGLFFDGAVVRLEGWRRRLGFPRHRHPPGAGARGNRRRGHLRRQPGSQSPGRATRSGRSGPPSCCSRPSPGWPGSSSSVRP